MQPFTYVRAASAERAISDAGAPTARFVAGGTSIVDLMKLGVEQPTQLVDINGLGLAEVKEAEGRVSIGALVRNSDLAYDPIVQSRYPALSEALLSGASPQLRNMATVGGNLLQRTRCPYFRDVSTPCNKRNPGAGCSALGGYTRSHAILGVSDHCIATHPSDLCVALAAFEATVHVQGKSGARAIPLSEFYRLPDAHPEIETVLEPGDLITQVSLPSRGFFAKSSYVKARDRAAYAFALASAAAALEIENGAIRNARVALGGVATVPWRSAEAEQALMGKPATRATFEAAAHVAVQNAKPQRDNAFKVPLVQRTLVRALERAGGAR